MKGAKLTARQIGETLHVATLLEGSVQRIGDRVRIALEVTDPARDSSLWSGTFDGTRGDIFATQDSIARAVTAALRVRFVGSSAQPLVRRATANPEAYDLYLQGRAIETTFTRDNLLRSLDYYHRAIALDSGLALPWAKVAVRVWLQPNADRTEASRASLTCVGA